MLPPVSKEHKLQFFTVYKDPADFPGMYVCRQFNIDQPTDNHFADEDYDKVLDWMLEQFKQLHQGAPYRLPPDPTDDPKIVETWI